MPLYHSYIHSYINYGNIGWRNATRANLKKHIVNRYMLSELYIVKIDYDILENSKEFVTCDLVRRSTVFCKFFPNERYYMFHRFYRFLALNVVLYILVFVYYSFYEIIFCIICISSKWEKQKKEKKISTGYSSNYTISC